MNLRPLLCRPMRTRPGSRTITTRPNRHAVYDSPIRPDQTYRKSHTASALENHQNGITLVVL